MLGIIPSNLTTYIDFDRFAENVIYGDQTPPADETALDANTVAVRITNSAQGKLVQATRQRNFYSLKQLRDMVRAAQSDDTEQSAIGEQILAVVADIAYCQSLQRKRYATGTPQAEDPACQRAEDFLDRLRRGERIFVLEGIEQTDDDGIVIGYYGSEISEAGLVEGSQLVAESINSKVNFWGCDTGRSNDGITNCPPRDGCC